MNKKQFGIIFTLLALVICVGLLTSKLNSNGLLNDPGDLEQVLAENEDKKEEETSAQKDFFFDFRSEKAKKDQETVQNYKAIIADKNTSKEQKTRAEKELLEKTKQKNNENRIEMNIKNKGLEDVLCNIDGSKAKIFVKAEGIDQKLSLQIKEIVQDVANISDLSIEVKK